MSLFASEDELQALRATSATDSWLADQLDRFLTHAARLTERPGLMSYPGSIHWWYAAYDRIACVAGAHTLYPSAQLATWLREVTLDLIRRPVSDWVGPVFRDHQTPEPIGHLETAHLSCALALVLDITPEVLRENERVELQTCMRERAIPMCRRWAEQRNWRNNWAMILLAGVALPAAVLHEDESLDWAACRYRELTEYFESDGSYGESLQYSSYAIFGLTLCYEALVRLAPDRYGNLPLPHAEAVRWWNHGHLGMKKLPAWSGALAPRSVNFNDGAATFRPHGDVLAHLAARSPKKEAGLARHLLETCYPVDNVIPDGDRASFGFVNQISWFSLLLRPVSQAALSPEAAELPTLAVSATGDSFVRQRWNGEAVLAIAGSQGPCKLRNHQHLDAGSFVLSHRGEQLLIDPGHCCYRSNIQTLNRQTDYHSTCTFSGKGQRAYTQGDQQSPEGRLLVAEQSPCTAWIGFDLSDRYGPVVHQFQRYWLLWEESILLIVDRMTLEQGVHPQWHWMLNGSDERSPATIDTHNAHIVRGGAGLRLCAPPVCAAFAKTEAYRHLAYHPEPGGDGEGALGSALRLSNQAETPVSEPIIHTILLDSAKEIAEWQVAYRNATALTIGKGASSWRVDANAECLRVGDKRFPFSP